MAVRTCTVSFTDPSGVRHSVDVTAESIFEAAALAVSALKNSGWVDAIAPGTELEIQMRERATCHRLALQQILRRLTLQRIPRWCDASRSAPTRR